MCESDLHTIRQHLSVLQEPLPLVPEPFKAYAEKLGCTSDALFELICGYLSKGIIRRIAGILKHHQAGYASNAMVALEVPPDTCDTAGEAISRLSFVTHCYRRTGYPDWPYTIYAMVHAKNDHELLNHIALVTASSMCEHFTVLHSLHEYKKTAFRI